MRETAFNVRDHASSVPTGAAIIVDPAEMDGLVGRLHDGDPTLGWGGDPRLAVAYNRQTSRWELHRLEADNEYRCIMRSKSGMGFPHNLIQHLMAHDGRRTDVFADIDQFNEAKRKADDEARLQACAEGYLRLGHAMLKDTDR